MRWVKGLRTLDWRRGWCRKRVKQYLPRHRETILRIESSIRWYVIQWLPREGWWVTSAGIKGAPVERTFHSSPRFASDAMKRRNAVLPGATALPALPATSLILGKLPAIREFLTATQYDDGSPRTPGYWAFRNRGTAFEVTLYDYDSATRLVARGPDIDHALLLAEQLLGVEEAPWEHDRYLGELLAKTQKRKRR